MATLFLFVASIFTFIVAQTHNDNCLAIQTYADSCAQGIVNNCKNASFIVNKPEWNLCENFRLQWHTPMYNLTIQFIPPSKFLKDQQHNYYRLCFEQNNYCFSIFRRFKNGEEKQVQWIENSSACFGSEQGIDGFTVRFQGPNAYTCSDTSIYYSFKQ